MLCREPERARQSKVARSGGPRDRGSAVLDQSDELVGGAEIRLMDDAGLAVDAGAFDDIVYIEVLLCYKTDLYRAIQKGSRGDAPFP